MDVHKVLNNPSKFFKKPKDVLLNKKLSKEDKKEILLVWKNDCRALMVTLDEGMEGGHNPSACLEEIMDCLITLEKD